MNLRLFQSYRELLQWIFLLETQLRDEDTQVGLPEVYRVLSGPNRCALARGRPIRVRLQIVWMAVIHWC